MSNRLPMFPLGSVLTPYGVLPLHIFEPRYRVLMFDCTHGEAEPEFGVVLIERGSEVGGNDERFSVGTIARIVEAGELPDGRWVLTTIGTSRFRVERWLPDDPYPLAFIDKLAETPWSAEADEARKAAEEHIRRALGLMAELGEAAPPATIKLADDPEVAAWQLVAVAPLGSFDKQRLLEIDDNAGRLRELAAMAEEEATVLAFRLAKDE